MFMKGYPTWCSFHQFKNFGAGQQYFSYGTLIASPQNGEVALRRGDKGPVFWYRPKPGFAGEDAFDIEVGPAGGRRTVWVTVRKPDAVNPEKNPTGAHSPEIEATLDKLRSQRRVDTGWSDTEALTPDQSRAIGEHVRACWTKGDGASADYRVLLVVTTDPTGTARRAEVASTDIARLQDAAFRKFAERAIRAVMDVRCANLPLPPSHLGRNAVLAVRFKP